LAGKPRLAVGLSYFNNIREIPRLLGPVYKHVDLVIGVDGRYPLFKWPSDTSTDGSTALLIEKYHAVVEINKSPVEQIDKRNQYMEIAEKAGMDFVIVLDTDEYLHPEYQNWQEFYKQLEELPDKEPFANMWAWIKPEWTKNHNTVKDNTWKLYTKILRTDLRYNSTHWTYIRKDDPSQFVFGDKTIDGIRITADSLLRSKKYQKAGYKWAGEQILEENKRMAPHNRQWINMLSKIHREELSKILAMPNVKIIEDNTEEQITKNLK